MRREVTFYFCSNLSRRLHLGRALLDFKLPQVQSGCVTVAALALLHRTAELSCHLRREKQPP
jgi:hypothetical protein